MARLSFPIRVAAIDIGSNALRFIAAEFAAADQPVILDQERAPVRLGGAVFATGMLSADAIEATLEVLRSWRQRIDALGIRHCRATATSAVRESRNGEVLVERARVEAGTVIDVITATEEVRLVHRAVRTRIPLGNREWLLADLGGGSAEIAMVDDSGVCRTESHAWGAVRLLDAFARVGEDPTRFRGLLDAYMAALHLPAAGTIPAGFIATGGNIEALVRAAAVEAPENGVAVLTLARLRQMIASLAALSIPERMEAFGLRENRADVILPAALVYEAIAMRTGADRIHVPNVGVRDGILLDLMDRSLAPGNPGPSPSRSNGGTRR